MTSETVVHSDTESGQVDAPRAIAPWCAGLVDGARSPFTPTSVAETLDMVVDLARRTFGADAAGVLLAAAGGAASIAASGAQARRADALQVDHHQGPGLHAIKGRQPVLSSELRFDSRWRFWAPQAADLGLRSALSLPLADSEPFGAVTLYSQHPSFFRTASLAPGLRFAQQAALAITAAAEREQLLTAADSRGVVGQPPGILIQRYQHRRWIRS